MAVELLPNMVPVTQRRFTVAEYDHMVEAGILLEDERVELIEGVIVEMSPIGRRHAACIKRLIALLSRQIGPAALLDIQNPIQLSDHSEPQPDAVLLRPRPDNNADPLPGPAHILHKIEVADTSQDYDQNV
jgi:Uma2 family endonuclease